MTDSNRGKRSGKKNTGKEGSKGQSDADAGKGSKNNKGPSRSTTRRQKKKQQLRASGKLSSRPQRKSGQRSGQRGATSRGPRGPRQERPARSEREREGLEEQSAVTSSANQTPAEEPKPGMRLNKYLASAGVSARRKADEIIKNGLVKVNDEVVREMGYRVMPGDKVYYKGKRLRVADPIYILMNKPKDFITTTSDERGRKTVMDLVQHSVNERIFPVGRLDRNTTGVLLITNDGELAEKLAHPRYEIEKLYAVELDKTLSKSDYHRIMEGLELEDGPIKVDEIAYSDPKNPKKVGVSLHSGRNRIVRRIFEHCGYEVVKLDRVLYAGLTKRGLSRGKWRHLKPAEVVKIKHWKPGQSAPRDSK